MVRIAGVLLLLIALYATLYQADPNAFRWSNLIDVANLQGRYGIITLGAAVLIITGAIDLSIGSVVGLSAVVFGLLVQGNVRSGTGAVSPYVAAIIVLAMGSLIGLFHGLLVTRLKLQAFLVTLCGLFIYRGIARYLTGSTTVGVASIKTARPDSIDAFNVFNRLLIGKDADGRLETPNQMILCLILAVIIGLVLHKSVIGRYWYAIGYNESAARYSGIATDGYRLLGFVICSMLASLAGIMLLLDVGTVNPDTAGDTWELWAITGAVLGGCSLKGGEGTAIGVVLGAMVLPLLRNVVSFLEIKDAIIPAVIGLTLLFGTIVDEFVRRREARRK